MGKIFWKRTFRELKKNFLRYFALWMLVILSMFLVVGIVSSAQSTIQTINQTAEEDHLEDGEFTLAVPLGKEAIQNIEKMGVTVEAVFSLDLKQKDNSVIRVMKNRRSINKIHISQGREAKQEDEIAVERIYAAAHHLNPGDTITLADKTFTICGIGTTGDYELCVQNPSDAAADGDIFGTAFVTPEAYENLKKSGAVRQSEDLTYAYHLGKDADADEVREYLSGRLLRFETAENNPRIKPANGDVQINIRAGLAAGVIVLMMLAFVISVFVVHSIDKESSVIGTLYAMGVKRKELLTQYTMLPVLICFTGGIIGTILGYSPLALSFLGGETYNYYSIPEIEICCRPALILYGTAVPAVTAYAVNWLVIRRRLGETALSLIRGGMKEKVSYVHLRPRSFVRNFQIRRILREKRSCLAILAGMLISLLVLDLGLNCYVLCKKIRRSTMKDTKYEYMYQLKQTPDTIPKGSEPAYAETFSKENMGYELNLTVIGLEKNNPFFPAVKSHGKDEISVSSSVAQKFHLEKGDTLTLKDKADGENHSFTVVEIVSYNSGLTCFMDIDGMRAVCGRGPEDYNVLYSDHSLDLKAGQIYTITEKKDVIKTGAVFMDLMMPMFFTMTGCGILIFLIVLYQMVKVMIDRASHSLSLMRLFGYRDRELKRLYLNGCFTVTGAGAVFMVPLAKWIMDQMYPSFVANIACGLDFEWEWQLYFAVYMGVIICYLIIQALVMGKLKKITPEEVLKQRE